VAALPRRNERAFFFSWTAHDGRLAEPRHAHNNVLIAARCSFEPARRAPIVGQSLRRVEMPSGMSAQIIGHKPSALAEKHYCHPLGLPPTWRDRIDAWMLEQARFTFNGIDAYPRLKSVSAR
jgi:hypothetical protein